MKALMVLGWVAWGLKSVLRYFNGINETNKGITNAKILSRVSWGSGEGNKLLHCCGGRDDMNPCADLYKNEDILEVAN